MHKTLICVPILLIGCSGSPSKVTHPLMNHLPALNEVGYSVDVTKHNPTNLPPLFDMHDLQKIGEVKAPHSDSVEIFTDIPSKIHIDNEGNIYVVHANTISIRIYDKDGGYLYSIGRRGRGPGEFDEIIKFVFDDNSQRLFVLDRFEIEVFKKSELYFEYDTTIQHEIIRAEDLCVIDDWVYISGYKINTESNKNADNTNLQSAISPPIHRYNLSDFEYEGSFGYIYKSISGWGYIDARLSETMLSCNSSTKTVVGILKRYSFLFGYSLEGEQKWVSFIEGYMDTQAEEHNIAGRPAFYPFTNSEVFNWKYPIQDLNTNAFLILQFGYTPLIDYIQFDKGEGYVRTIAVNTNNGELFYSDNYPYIGAWRDKTVIMMDLNSETLDKSFLIYGIK